MTVRVFSKAESGRRCRARTLCGFPCRRWIASGNGLCATHRGRLWLVRGDTAASI
jgi:hypothetical protein